MTGAFQGPAKGIFFTPDNKHAYAYNQLTVNNATATFIEFNTFSYYLVGTIQMGRNMKSGAETDFSILFNNKAVYSAKYDNGTGQTLVMPTQAPLPIVIPPHTHVILQCEVNDDSDVIAVNFTAQVHGSIDQTDLEV